MRLNRKWFYLGGLVTILTLLLTLTLVLPAGAVGRLDPGSLTAGKAFVSPDGAVETTVSDPATDGTIKVTMTNLALDVVQTVDENNDDILQVVLSVTAAISPTSTDLLVIDLDEAIVNAPVSNSAGAGVLTTDNAITSAHLPILGGLQVTGSFINGFASSDIGTPVIRNAADGVIEIPINGTIPSGADIELSYQTSKQQSALVNIRGDSRNFDLLLVEGKTTPGVHSESFVAVDSDLVTLNPAQGVIHEQHVIPSGLQSYRELEGERISAFSTAHNTDLGTLSSALPAGGVANDVVVYVQVANPPIRKRDATSGAAVNIGLNAANDVIYKDIDTLDTPTVVSAEQGILSFAANTTGTAKFTGATLDLDYIGSDSFSISVDHGPIDLGTAADLDATLVAETVLSGDAAPSVSSGQIKIVLPTTDDDSAAPSGHSVLELVSITDDGNRCKQCKIRLGVTTDPKNGDEPNPFNSRYSVLGISYVGWEPVNFPNSMLAEGESYTFQRTLLSPPADPDNDGSYGKSFSDLPAGLTMGFARNDTDTADRVSGRSVWFTMSNPVDSPAGPAITLSNTDTFNVGYDRKVGALPRNALNPDAGLRPVVAVGQTGRVLVTSGNDSLRINAEGEGPKFSNPAPAHKAGSLNNDETISIDVTDSQSGVDKTTIELTVTAGSGNPWNVENKDLTITDIDGGYRASIALDEVRDDGAGVTLSVSATADTTIAWSATAEDLAGNTGTSDADTTNLDDDDEPILDPYTFAVDGVSPTMERAYTGDWYNPAGGEEGRVEGDRLISPNNYLPGGSKATSIRVVFSEVLDGATVEASDFTVDGVTPSAAQWYGMGSTDGAGEEPNEDTVDGEIGRSIFLTVPAKNSDETPTVALVGSVSDKAGNAVTNDSKVAADGMAPGATLRVDVPLSQKTVVITVTADEDISGAHPELNFWVSDALDTGFLTLDEMDIFTVGRENPDGPSDNTNPLVLRDSANQVVFSGNLNAAELPAGQTSVDLPLTLSKAPMLDRSSGSRTGDVDGNDITVEVVQANPVGTVDSKVTEDTAADTVVNPRSGRINLKIQESRTGGSGSDILDFEVGDEIHVTYRGTAPDRANPLNGVPEAPSGRRASDGGNVWTYEVDISRNDRFAVTATMEDDERNEGSGGIGNPKTNGAVVFEIDSELAGNSEMDAESTPDDAPAGADPVAFDDSFDIELSWPDEANEYVGDSVSTVTLVKAELDGIDVMEFADRQNAYTYVVSIEGISLGQHTLSYRAEDAVGNTSSSDRTLEFSVKERPTWDLNLRKGNNLISIPADPSNSDINAVFGGVSEIDLVYTFEGNLVRVALPGPDGEFIGALKTIDSRHAYWVSANSAVTVPINIGATGSTTVLPSLQVKGGQWNLIPVMSLGRVDDSTPGDGAEAGTPVDPDSYLGDFQVAFGSERGRWMRIDPDGPSRPKTDNDEGFDRMTDDLPSDPPDVDADAADTPLKVGMGYWVLYTEDAFITPR